VPNPYSSEMRERVISRVESGASRREAAEHFAISASSAVKWLQRWRDAGSSRAMPSGGSTSPLEKRELAARPDRRKAGFDAG
jgi:transposase